MSIVRYVKYGGRLLCYPIHRRERKQWSGGWLLELVRQYLVPGGQGESTPSDQNK